MSERSSQWWMTCGIGCGVILVILIGVGVVGGLFLKSQFQGVLDASKSQERLIETLGSVRDYNPKPDGSIAPDRIEAFLAVRESLRAGQERIDGIIADFPPDEILQEGSSPISKVLSVIREAGGLLDPLAGYVEDRNQALLHSGMGLGEYLYIYTTAYFSWLEHSPEDGPMITKGKGPNDPPERLLGGQDSDWGPARTRTRYRRHAITLLGNQLRGVETAARVNEDLKRLLEKELRRFERSPSSRLWEEGLPQSVEDSLQPYRKRFEETYHAGTNCFEFPRSPEAER